jgi:dUTP pyrophosphatase
MKVKLKIFTDKPFRMPTQATPGSAGWDIHSTIDITLPPMELRMIPVGFGLQIPRGHYVSILPRSSFGKKKIIIANSPGTIDSDFTGEIHVMLHNLSNDFFYIKEGDRIAQMVLQAYNDFNFQVVPEFEQTQRGEGGFGSTGYGYFSCPTETVRSSFEEEGD